MIDVSAQVLVNGGTAPGWKMMAALELFVISGFFCFLVIKGIHFLQATHWEPMPNVRR